MKCGHARQHVCTLMCDCYRHTWKHHTWSAGVHHSPTSDNGHSAWVKEFQCPVIGSLEWGLPATQTVAAAATELAPSLNFFQKDAPFATECAPAHDHVQALSTDQG